MACTDNTEKRLRAFLGELALLQEKYGIVVCGCGCCGSPYLVDSVTERIIAENMYFKNGKYAVEEITEEEA